MKNYSSLLSFILITCSSISLQANTDILLAMNLEDLTEFQISSVVNRYDLDSTKSASPVTIITEEEIQKHGYKTLEELLQSVVGFDQGYHIRRSVVSNRGYYQDINSNYLLLVDGHRINENAYSGFGVAQIYPLMDNIKKVEIIRGPSSTLWGNSALNGIISITTKDPQDYMGSDRDNGVLEGSIDYEVENNRKILNASYAKNGEDYSFVASALYFDNDVDITNAYYTNENTPYEMVQANYDFDPSYQLQTKFRYKDIIFNMQYTNYDRRSNGETYRYTQEQKETDPEKYRDSDGYFALDQSWIELLYTPKLTKTLSLEARLSYEYTKKEETREYLDTGYDIIGASYTDKGVTTEIILHQDTPDYHFLGGIYTQIHKLINDIYLPNYNYKSIREKTYATFGEINYNGLAKWIFTLGARYEYANERGDAHSFLPRMMIYRQLSYNSYIKYMYNTGSLRPTLITTRDYVVTTPRFGEFYAQGSEKSQKNASNSLQFGYKGEQFDIVTTLFYDQMKDLILWGNATLVGQTADGYDIRLWETNLADITEKGIEIEAKYYPSQELSFYATYGYAKTEYDQNGIYYAGEKIVDIIGTYSDSSMVMPGAPEQTWNLGFDWDIYSNISWNLNYHGRYGILSVYPVAEYNFYEFEHFFDTNIHMVDLYKDGLVLDLYGKNLTDNRGRFPGRLLSGYGEIETQLGRQIGIKLQYRF
ncbi:MAG: TonB-dependent receptor [Epsilonproteobacteria bacterium]|nr:TonB-dependent receptor [Campylobacterota bacterium]